MLVLKTHLLFIRNSDVTGCPASALLTLVAALCFEDLGPFEGLMRNAGLLLEERPGPTLQTIPGTDPSESPPMGLDQDPANFFCKVPDGKYLQQKRLYTVHIQTGMGVCQ